MFTGPPSGRQKIIMICFSGTRSGARIGGQKILEFLDTSLLDKKNATFEAKPRKHWYWITLTSLEQQACIC